MTQFDEYNSQNSRSNQTDRYVSVMFLFQKWHMTFYEQI